MFVEYNPNPVKARVGDCAVRAIAKTLDMTWEKAYLLLCVNGFKMGDLPSSNLVTNATLREYGYKKANVPNSCPDCFSVSDFARNNPKGKFFVGTGKHVVAIDNGSYFDTWNSGAEIIAYVWYKDTKPIFDT